MLFALLGRDFPVIPRDHIGPLAVVVSAEKKKENRIIGETESGKSGFILVYLIDFMGY